MEKVSSLRTKRRRRSGSSWIGYLFIGPWLICFLAFTAIPFVASFFLSFTEYNMLSAPKFIGLDNYIEMFTNDNLFSTSMGVTFQFVFVSIPLRLIFALLVAMILNRKSKAVPFYRVVYYRPSILGGSVAVSVMWKYCFSKTGVVNTFLNALGIPSDISWISNKDTALWCIILLFIWQFGSPMLIFLSGLKQIPQSYYEAAVVDGAGPVKKFFKITLPYMLYVTTPYLIVTFTGNVNNFNVIYLLSGGDPVTDLSSTAGKTDLLVTWLYKLTIDKQYYNIGAVIGILTFVILAVAALLTYRNTKSYKEEGGF